MYGSSAILVLHITLYNVLVIVDYLKIQPREPLGFLTRNWLKQLCLPAC